MDLRMKSEDIRAEAEDMFSAIEAGLNDAPDSQTTMDASDALAVVKALFQVVLGEAQL